MNKIFLPFLFVIIFITTGNAQQKLFDQKVQLKTCNISIDANAFIATTMVELEFYNPKDEEVEGYQTFELNRGQVITAFQLDLNGKYREGSIEERWKANRAYSSIVGKRIDPAILQMDWQNHYSLRIYPIAAKSSRKINFTITQAMQEDSSLLTYNLPLNFTDVTETFKLDIKFNNTIAVPYGNKGFLQDQLFTAKDNISTFNWQAKNISVNKPISFSVNQLNRLPQVCFSKKDNTTYFLMRVLPNITTHYNVQPKAIHVYWDVSKSAKGRDLVKELNFLEKYIAVNEINKTTITLFNHKLQQTLQYTTQKNNFNSIRNYLLDYDYKGATALGNLNFSTVQADAVLLFSDGINAIGNALPKAGAIQVNCIVSAASNNLKNLLAITGTSGGAVINLNNTSVADAVKKIEKAENFLVKYNGNSINIKEQFPIKLGKSILLSGTIQQQGNLQLLYGNNSAITKTEDYFLSATDNCSEEAYKKLLMLKAYDSLMYNNYQYYHWQNMVVFGLTEKVVTPQTSYLVLERIEDYINYKIAPPKELEEKCAELNYVYRSDYKIQALKQYTEQDALQAVANEYNKKVRWWNAGEALIDITKTAPVQKTDEAAAITKSDKGASSALVQSNTVVTGGGQLNEVVVTAAYGIKRSARSASGSVQYVTAAQLNTIRQTDINNALAGKVAGLQVRSQSYAKLGAETMIRLRGANSLGTGSAPLYVVDGTIMSGANDINVDDIEDVTVLQGPAAAALFGPDGANGAIVMNTKRAKRTYQYPQWTEYKLSHQEDVDYLEDIRKAAYPDLWDAFKKLEKEYSTNIAFYFDMADYFFEKRKNEEATEILYSAIELCKGSSQGLKIAAYTLEKWKKFDAAIEIYEGILQDDAKDLAVKRDMALAYFQNKNYQAAIKTYYEIITVADAENNFLSIKENALSEMNTIISLNIKGLDISFINPNLIKALPVDLRIVVGGNYTYVNNLQITEPKNQVCNYTHPNTANGGRLQLAYNLS
ncbi:MAG: VIT domain-containing protein, partial [Ferruginibacter sp.]